MDESLYLETVSQMAADPRIKSMRQYRQHGSSNTYEHSLHVAMGAYRLAKHMHISVDEKSMARGAMLHDFYLYDIGSMNPWVHGTGHAQRALENSKRCYELNPLEEDIIYSHMWPLNITHIPHYKESVLIGLADKYSALAERFHIGRRFIEAPSGATA